MVFLPLDQAISKDCFKNVRLIATDMDGTLTQSGKFTPALLQALEDLAKAGMAVLIVTGRSAGWVSGLASYLPVVGAIAENGGLFYPSSSDRPLVLLPISDPANYRRQLATVFYQLRAKFPQIQESADNCFRITDWTFDNREIAPEQLPDMADFCDRLGWGFTYSSVQCHIKPQQQDKASGLLKVLADYFPECSLDQVVTVGDSPNDESLFNPEYFPISVGVANVLDYVEAMNYHPAFVTNSAEGEGFCELARTLGHAQLI